jgi:hypothetical protein
LRDIFRAFIPRDEDSFAELWKLADVTFDANVLLDLYGTTKAFNDSFFEIIESLTGRLFLTHQAGLEFYRNRKRIIESARELQRNLGAYLTAIPSAFSDDAQKKLEEFVTAERDSVSKFLKGDPIEEKIFELFGAQLDPALPVNQQSYSEIDVRYEKQIPPGFADLKDKDDYKKYGDATLWLEVIEHARRQKKPIILVTSEKKFDWWAIEKGKIVGPRPELAAEIYQKAGVDFHLYSFESFLKFAPNFLKTKASQPSQQSVRELARLEQARVQTEAASPAVRERTISHIDLRNALNPFWTPPISGAFDSSAGSAPVWRVGSVAPDPVHRLLDLAKRSAGYDIQTQNEIAYLERELYLRGPNFSPSTITWRANGSTLASAGWETDGPFGGSREADLDVLEIQRQLREQGIAPENENAAEPEPSGEIDSGEDD